MKTPLVPLFVPLIAKRRWLPAALALLVLALPPLTLHATNYYFSNLTGNDTNSGTQGSPKKSLSAAAGLATAGNTLFFKRGESWSDPLQSLNLQGKNGTSTNRIYIDAYGTSVSVVPGAS